MCLRCGHIGATWRIWLNLCFFGPPDPQRKRQIDRFSRFCTAHGKVPILYSLQWATFPPKLPLLMGDLDPDLIHDSLGHSEIIIQTASRSVQPFSHRWPQCPYTLLWAPLSPKIASSHAVIWTPSNTIPWARPRPQPKRHLDRFSCFCRAHLSDRPTDRLLVR